jgi:DNA replication protein
MCPFEGFPSGKVRLTPIPATFFIELLPQIDDLVELKVTLYAMWFLDRQEGNLRYVASSDFTSDAVFMNSLGDTPETAKAVVNRGLKQAVERGTLLLSEPDDGDDPKETIYFLNSPRGRAALLALENGAWVPDSSTHVIVSLSSERPNIFALYEENFGPLTPLLADMLQDAEHTYPMKWIEDAMRLAVQSNRRSWRYVESILRRWQEKGRDDSDRRNHQKDWRKYVEGEFSDFIDH